MKVSGLNITIVRGETANITFDITDEFGRPFILLAEDMFEQLNFRFRVKKEPFSIVTTTYILDKVFDINGFRRFDNANIINIKEYTQLNGGTYNDEYWAGNTIPNNEWPNQLFYHPGLESYAFYNDGDWEEYFMDITVPFIPSDTEKLDYGDYYYDGVIEAGNYSGVEYTLVVIPQHTFTIDYRT